MADDLEDSIFDHRPVDTVGHSPQTKASRPIEISSNEPPEIDDQEMAPSKDLTGQTSHTSSAEHPPIVRPPFPAQVRDRSPIIGLSADMQLRTCFRIGEALNAGSSALRNNKTVMIELYARVTSSWREENGVKQHFVFADLFHKHPPFLEGSYDLWKSVELWDYDSGRFLGSTDKMCRCIGKLKKDGQKWMFTALNVWEASWEDIEFARGIVCA